MEYLQFKYLHIQMHIIKIKTKITDLSLGQVRPGVGKVRPETIFSAAHENLKQIIKIINFRVFNQILGPSFTNP